MKNMNGVNQNKNDMNTFQTASYTNIDLGYHPILKNGLENYGSSDDKETKHKQEYSSIYQSQQLFNNYVQNQESSYYISEFTP